MQSCNRLRRCQQGLQIRRPALAEIIGGRPVVDGVDDLGCVDPVGMNGRDGMVDVAELALDHVQGHVLASHLDGMRVAQLIRGEAAPDAGSRDEHASPVGAPPLNGCYE
jgi:hypothetical protein